MPPTQCLSQENEICKIPLWELTYSGSHEANFVTFGVQNTVSSRNANDLQNPFFGHTPVFCFYSQDISHLFLPCELHLAEEFRNVP